MTGENVPADSLRLAWRNTTQPLAWDRSIYADVYAAVRKINRGLSPNRRMRLIALDPPIDWTKVQSVENFPRIWGYRDPVWFQTLESESLSKKRRVLVIAGGLHILRRDPPDFQPRAFERRLDLVSQIFGLDQCTLIDSLSSAARLQSRSR